MPSILSNNEDHESFQHSLQLDNEVYLILPLFRMVCMYRAPDRNISRMHQAHIHFNEKML